MTIFGHITPLNCPFQGVKGTYFRTEVSNYFIHQTIQYMTVFKYMTEGRFMNREHTYDIPATEQKSQSKTTSVPIITTFGTSWINSDKENKEFPF